MGYISQLRVACSNTASDRMNSKIGTPAGSTKDVYHYVNLEGFLKCFEKTFSGLMNSAEFKILQILQASKQTILKTRARLFRK